MDELWYCTFLAYCSGVEKSYSAISRFCPAIAAENVTAKMRSADADARLSLIFAMRVSQADFDRLASMGVPVVEDA